MSNFIATVNRTKEILRTYGFSFKKSLGQNFLVDVNILKKMIEQAGIDHRSGVIEIGPGIGSLTEQLALHANLVIAYEIDPRLMPILEDTLQTYNNVEIIHADILKVNVQEAIEAYFSPSQAVHVVANLPYYITSPILIALLQAQLRVESFTVMIQKEVAERMAAKPNSKSYGSLSIAVQYYTDAKSLFDVPKTAFIPQPNVTSTVLSLTKREAPPVSVIDEAQFFEVVRACFRHRRKTIVNNLAEFNQKWSKQQIIALLEQINISPQRRGESLTMEEYALLSNTLNNAL